MGSRLGVLPELLHLLSLVNRLLFLSQSSIVTVCSPATNDSSSLVASIGVVVIKHGQINIYIFKSLLQIANWST